MRSGLPKILVTGGAGFIGSAFVRLALKCGYNIAVVDKLTYAGDIERLEGAGVNFRFYKADICDKNKIKSIFKSEKPGIVVNFAAQTHVDRSIRGASDFIKTNVSGTHVLLEAARSCKIKKFVHLSTDEVYGEIIKGRFSENHPLKPSSPYSATKAAADLLVNSYVRTYSFPAVIIRPCNNYGPWQYPEKFIPLSILKILRGEKIPLYGDGRNVREWLYVDDCAAGILSILKRGRTGSVYNLGSRQEMRNIEVARTLLKKMCLSEKMIQFVCDRPGHDIRYSLNSDRVFKETGWRPKVKFDKGLEETLNWCILHKKWLLSKWRSVSRLYK